MSKGKGEHVEYDDNMVGAIELLWGEGFLSPGGREEVALILDGLDLAGKSVLDVGCGTGGVDVLLVREHGADQVLGIDVEQPVLDQSIARARREGLADRLSFRKVAPGAFPLEDESFDVVFSKDAMIHIGDKAALFAEVYRVLRPGGCFAASDWMCRDEEPPSAEMQHYLGVVGLTFGMHSPPVYRAALEAAGFERIELVDRNRWAAEILRRDYAMLSGPMFHQLKARVGDAADDFVELWRAGSAVMDSGELRPGHLRAFKPAG